MLTEFPANVGCETVPVRVAALPVNAGALFVPCGVKFTVPLVGGFAGHAIVPAGVNDAVLFVPAAVTVCVCVDIALPVKVSAGTVKLLPGETPPIFEKAPVLLPARLPLVVATDAVLFVPAGVPALVPPEVTWEPVKVSAGTVPALPVKAGTFAG